MRIHIRFSPTDEVIPFNYQPMLTGALHNWIGQNNIHDDISLYSFSWLKGGKPVKEGIHFKQGGRFFISSFSNDLLKKIIQGIQSDPAIGYDISVVEVIVQEDPDFEKENTFFCASPILVKRMVNDKEIHFTYEQEESDQFLMETFKTKLIKAGISDEGANVQFDRSYHSPKTKVIYYKDIGNRANICPVKIKGSKEQLRFAWNVGVGNSTGIGFGALS